MATNGRKKFFNNFNHDIMIKYYISLLLIFALISCKKDKNIKPTITVSNTTGVFIVNEGNFQWANATLSFIDFKNNKIQNDLFQSVNNAPLGDVAQSMTIIDSLAYIVVNNSGKIYIINKNTCKYSAKITNLTSPRYMLKINEQKAYLSDYKDKRIVVINLLSNTISGYININHTSEKLVKFNNKVFVTSWSYDNKVMVIDSEVDLLIDSIIVGKQPNSIVIDKNNKLWVLCDGGFYGSSYGQENAKLIRINPTNNQIEKTLAFSDINMSPTELSMNMTKDTLFYLNNGIFKQSINEENLNSSVFITQANQLFYGLSLDSVTGKIYISDVVDYVSNGTIYIYSQSGKLLNSYKAGVNPGEFCFMY